MHRIMRQLVILFLLASSVSLFSASVSGADKVTGEFIRAPNPDPSVVSTQITEVSAHEAFEGRPQKGYLLTHNVTGTWRLIDLSDSQTSCVNVHGEGRARLGGVVTDGHDGNQMIGRVLGYDLADGGQPIVDEHVDFLTIIVFGQLDPESPDEVLGGFLHWCQTGELLQGTYLGSFPKYVKEGNLKVHNH